MAKPRTYLNNEGQGAMIYDPFADPNTKQRGEARTGIEFQFSPGSKPLKYHGTMYWGTGGTQPPKK